MTAGSGMKNIQALIPIVGSGQGRLCGRGITQQSVLEEEPDIVLVGFERKSSRFRGLVLNLLGVTPVIEQTEPTDLPEYYLVRVSTVSFRLFSECRFRDNDFKIMC